MKHLDYFISLFLIGLSVIISLASHKLGIGSLENMGPGFMPFLTSLFLFCLSLSILVIRIIESKKNGREITLRSWKSLLKPASLVIMLCVYIFLLETLGYLFTTFLLMLQMFLISEPKKWQVNILLAVMIALLSFLIFKWLQIQLPIGKFRLGW